MEEYDANKDGKISGAELDKCPGLRAMSTDGKGAVTADMINNMVASWRQDRLARLSATCQVMRKGKPLADAEVKFVPENFIGSNLPIGTGKTNDRGVASISMPLTDPNDMPGIPPAVYKIEITKSGDNIPAKYNTSTTLGKLLGWSIEGGYSQPPINLKY